MRLSAKLPSDDEGARLMRFEDVRGSRNTYDRVGGAYSNYKP